MGVANRLSAKLLLLFIFITSVGLVRPLKSRCDRSRRETFTWRRKVATASPLFRIYSRAYAAADRLPAMGCFYKKTCHISMTSHPAGDDIIWAWQLHSSTPNCPVWLSASLAVSLLTGIHARMSGTSAASAPSKRSRAGRSGHQYPETVTCVRVDMIILFRPLRKRAFSSKGMGVIHGSYGPKQVRNAAGRGF